MEDPRKTVLHETAIIGIGELICVALMFLCFALIRRFDLSVLAGGLVGMILAVGNFFFMAISVSQAAEKAVQQDVSGGKGMIHTSYIIRMLMIFLILCGAAYFGKVNVIAAVIPLACVRMIVMVSGFFRKDPVPEEKSLIDEADEK